MSGTAFRVVGFNVALLCAAVGLVAAGLPHRERALVPDGHAEKVRALESTRAAASPTEPGPLVALTQAYLDARAPGMAVQALEAAPLATRRAPAVEHAYARALLDQGRSSDALAAEKRVLTACATAVELDAPPCSSWLVASATRRADILEELVRLGVEDAHAHPEASQVAYYRATRQVTFASR